MDINKATIKKKIFCLFLSLLSLTGYAQSRQEQAQIQKIRMLYTKAQEKATRSIRQGGKHDYMQLAMNKNMPGSGITYVNGEFFCPSTEKTATTDVSPYLVRLSWNVSALKRYQEFLYDTQSGDLLFSYKKGDILGSNEEDSSVKSYREEYRIYYYKGKPMYCISRLTPFDEDGNLRNELTKEEKGNSVPAHIEKETREISEAFRNLFNQAISTEL